ncbi:putative benzyl alcohol O-benzoyltransferase [Helianthus annuus]|uniref:Benzyl alcohol O-benzoyltransferase n=1 Tax=Helianthus annuus TaxID=4232 RepID=A0A9K3P4A3_HELAN|nr:benzyl alcohol O-benzoyltransferase-like [Helianthus annuus]KAF5823521.1 putative benzyl alcohol O-benzoyltransferase [Helianthus annuus]KAJ0949569.1 putative benzyl alcohol O-benzoyltransferase [Helianthus annuus]
MQASTSLTFEVKRRAPELIAPATPTPREVKLLSDIDDQKGFRYVLPIIQFHHRNPKMGNKNPASVIREALAKVLVFYYPLAGRLKEGPGEKLMVDCTGEGVLFIEAEADVTLEQFGKTLHPPFPCVEKLICIPSYRGILGSPLVYIQVTRLLCGGFIFTSGINHTICDAVGNAQFLIALGEMAQGALEPSVLPVWQRELLYARDPPHVTFPHPEYDDVVNTKDNHIFAVNEMADKSFFFGPTEMSALRRFVPEHLERCTTFEVLTACLWRCRTIALEPSPEEDMRLIFPINARDKFNPPIPVGYYGNCIVLPCVVSKARDLINKPLGHALELVKKAKSSVTEEYVRSTADLMVVKGRAQYKFDSTFVVSNLSRVGFNKVNFGWGESIYAGLAKDDKDIPGVFSNCMPSTNEQGELGIVVIVGLPLPAMEKFVKQLKRILIPGPFSKI